MSVPTVVAGDVTNIFINIFDELFYFMTHVACLAKLKLNKTVSSNVSVNTIHGLMKTHLYPDFIHLWIQREKRDVVCFGDGRDI